MPQKTRVGNYRSQSTTDVPRRRNRNEKLYKAGARSSVTLAAQNADRRAAVSEIESALSTHTRLSRLSARLTGVLCKRPFAEFPRESEFGDSGHRRRPTGNVSKLQ